MDEIISNPISLEKKLAEKKNKTAISTETYYSAAQVQPQETFTRQLSSSSKPNISQKSSSRPSSKHVDTFMQEQTAAKQASDKPLTEGPVTPTQIKGPGVTNIQTPTRQLSIETPSQETPRVNSFR